MIDTVRTLFLFPTDGRDAAVAMLDAVAVPDGVGGWVFSDLAWIRVQADAQGLYADWPPEDVAALGAELRQVPEWGVIADISATATAESLMPLLQVLLGAGGVALDDSSNLPWSLTDIQRGEHLGRPAAFAAFHRD